MELEQTVALMAAGGIVAIIQHGQTILQSVGWKIAGSIKVLTAFGLSLGAAALVLIIGEGNGAPLATDNVEDWIVAFGIVLGGSQTIFAIVLPTLGSVTKD